MRAAVYARFSSDLQRDRSIEDQVALCRQHAERSGWCVTHTFEDRARSGASVIGRDGIMRLMDAARDRAFDVVVVEALDRLSRDQEDLAGIYKRLTFLGLEIRAVHDGRADHIQVGIRGLVGALYLQDLAHKVRRGMAGVVRDGRHAGGRSYGYRAVPGSPGALEIVDEEAAVLRRIFAAYAAGDTPRDIVAGLNAEGLAPPRGRFWAASTINGNRQRGTGIIANEIYAGRLVWNRVRMIKDPDTGRRVSRVNPKIEWQRADAPHLRIVDDDLFEAAQLVKGGRSSGDRPQDRRKPRHLLSGLLRCSCCGAGMAVKDKDHGRVRIMCTQAKEAGTCSNRRPYYLDAIERAVVGGLQQRLKDRRAIEIYVRAYNAERQKLAGDSVNARAKLEALVAAAEREHERMLNAYLKGFLSEEEASRRLPDLRAERERMAAELSSVDAPLKVVTLHPTAINEYVQAIGVLEKAIARGVSDGSEESRKALRDLVDAVIVHPPAEDRSINIEVRGHLSRLVGGEHFPTAQIKGGSLVAEARYRLSPPTIPLPFTLFAKVV